MSLFFSGAITDWLGVWTEIGYLGNNSLRSVTPDRQNEQTGVNFFAYDEYRINASWDFGKNSFYGFSMGNEHPNVGAQFQYPLPLPDLWSNGQGGVGRSMNMANLSAFMFYNDRLYLQVAGVTGADNTNWSDGSNYYLNVSYDWFRKTRNDLWLIGEYYAGNDFPSIMTRTKDSFLCTGVCPPGVTDQNLSISNTPGDVIVNAPVESVRNFDSFRLSLEHSAADRGPHTWYAATTFLTMTQNFESGAKVEDTQMGAYLRYFYAAHLRRGGLRARPPEVRIHHARRAETRYVHQAELRHYLPVVPGDELRLLVELLATHPEHRLRGRARALQRQGVELRPRNGIQLLMPHTSDQDAMR